MKRKHMSNSKSRRYFKQTSGIHPKNLAPMPMRGGIRA